MPEVEKINPYGGDRRSKDRHAVVGGVVALAESQLEHRLVAVVEAEFAPEAYKAVVLTEYAHGGIPDVHAYRHGFQQRVKHFGLAVHQSGVDPFGAGHGVHEHYVALCVAALRKIRLAGEALYTFLPFYHFTYKSLLPR